MTKEQRNAARALAIRETRRALSDDLCWARGAPSKRTPRWRATIRSLIQTLRDLRAAEEREASGLRCAQGCEVAAMSDGRTYTLANLKVTRIERCHGGVDVEIAITGPSGSGVVFGMDTGHARHLADEIRRLAGHDRQIRDNPAMPPGG